MKSAHITLALTLLTPSIGQAVELLNKDGTTLSLSGYIMGDYHFAKKNATSTYGDQSNSRFILNGASQINHDLNGFGFLQYNLPINKNDNSFFGSDGQVQLGYVGLTHSTYGTLQYGQNWGVIYDVAGYADMLPEFGEDTLGYFSEVSAATDLEPNSMFGSGRGNGMLQYRNSYGGFDIGLQYLASNTGIQGQGGGISLQYTFDTLGITVGAAYNSGQKKMAAIRDASNSLAPNFNDNQAKMWTLGAKYNQNNIYLAAVYAETESLQPYIDSNSKNNFADKTKAYFLVAQYDFDFGLTPGIAYAHGKAERLTGYGSQDYSRYVDLSVSYALNSHFTIYADHKFNLLDENAYTQQNAVITDDITALALQYNF